MPATHEPTRSTRAAVTRLAAAGLTQTEISDILDIHADTLRKYYRKELDTATNKITALAVDKLVEGIHRGEASMIFFWLKCRARWREKHDYVEQVAPLGDLNIVDLNEDYVNSLEDEEANEDE